MGRIYTVSFAGTVTNAGGDCDLLEIAPADDKPVKLRGWCLGQTSEVGDTAEEGLRISVILLPATFTTGNGTSTTPAPMDTADVAAGATCKTNGSSVATTSGTAVTRGEFAWNERNSPYDFWYPDVTFCPKVKQGEGLVVRMQTTPADDFSAAMTFWIEEE